MKAFGNSTHTSEIFLLWGASGWIGNKLVDLIGTNKNWTCYKATSRIENRQDVLKDIEIYKPTRVLIAAGITGTPNVDWCETHKQETIRTNIIGILNVLDCCFIKGLHCTLYATGCIYEYYDLMSSSNQVKYALEYSENVQGGKPYTEEDKPNFKDSWYSETKVLTEYLIKKCYLQNTLVLRIRMPISEELDHPKNFISKITKYPKIINIPNSMTILPDLLPVSLIMSVRALIGIYNFVNPGVISHNEILDMYKEYIDPDFHYENFTLQEHDQILIGRRSNNHLSSLKMEEALPDIYITPVGVAVEQIFKKHKYSQQSR